MNRSRTLAVLALTAFSATPALAQTASSPTRLSGVTVMAPAPALPKVVSTFPEEGKAVAPGALILKVTFDQKMDPGGWDFGKGPQAYPDCLDRPRSHLRRHPFHLRPRRERPIVLTNA